MELKQALKGARETLQSLATPDLDSEVLLGHVIGKPREFALTHPEVILADEEQSAFERLVARRAAHEPVAYLTNHKEFYGRGFFVDSRVHIPKPATEDLIDAIKRDISEHFDGRLADIGTGSGCIAVTLALEFPKAHVTAIDISKDALAVAEKNAKTHNARSRIAFATGSRPYEPVDVIAANLPYGWRDGWTDDAEVAFQPEISYISGDDGLDAIRELIAELPSILNKNGRAYLEYDPRQTQAIKKLASDAGYTCAIIKDSAGFERIACLTK